MKKLLCLIVFFPVGVIHAQEDRTSVYFNQAKFKIIGDLGVELGTIVTVKGLLIDGFYKGYRDGPNLRVQKINDSSIQNVIEIPLKPYAGKFGEKFLSMKALPKLEEGATYSFRVYETGRYVGIPYGAFKESGIIMQTTGFYFQNELRVISGEKIDSIEWSPADFQGRYALLSGIAMNMNDTAIIQTSKWKLKLIGSPKWGSAAIGKIAEIYGKVKGKEGNYYVGNGDIRLIRLEDQLGQTVRLRGIALNSNQNWWFNYRGTDIHIENSTNLPSWIKHFSPVEVTGILEKAKLPNVREQDTEEEHPVLTLQFIILKPFWKPIDGWLLTPELWVDQRAW